MDHLAKKFPLPGTGEWLVGGGEIGRLIRTIDWSGTPLGPAGSWPQSLKSTLGILLSSKVRMILFWGADLIAFYNEPSLSLLGARHPLALGMPARDIWPERWNFLEPLLAGVMRTGEASPGNGPLTELERRRDERERFFDFSCAPVRDENGSVAGVFCLADATAGPLSGRRPAVPEASVQAMETLRMSEEHFRHYFDLGLIGMAITSPSKRCMAVNDKICKILGYEPAEMLERTWSELTYPDDLASDVAQFNRVMAGELEGYSLDKRFIRKDGNVIDATISVRCLRRPDGSVDSFLALLEDLTERKEAEKRALFQADLLNVVEQAVITTDLDGVITFWNRFAEKLYGWRNAEVIGRPILEILPFCFPQEQMPKIMNRLRAGKSWSGEIPAKRRDGSAFPAMVVNTPIFNRSGTVVGVIGTSSDITVKKEAEALLMRKTAAAEELSHLKSKFVSMVSHELRTPLNAIVGFITLLKDPRVDGDASKRAAMVDHVDRNAKNLVHLVNAVLDLVRIEAGKMTIRTEEVLLPELLKEVMTDLRFQAEQKGLTLTFRERPDLPPLRSDAGMLRQIFANLISNAIKFTPRGSIEIRIRSVADQKKLRIEVEDTGIGIDPDALPHIFEPFFQVYGEGRPSPAGTGLGLAIVQEFTQLLGGTVEVVSRPQAGSRFTVTFPLEPDRSAERFSPPSR